MNQARGRRPGPTVRVRVSEFTEGRQRRREDRVITEEPLELRVAWPGRPAQRAWVTMRTPGHDFELAAGWVRHEGITTEVVEIAYCTDVDLRPEQEFNVVTLTLAGPPPIAPAARHDALSAGSSACGVCGVDSIEAVLAHSASRPAGVAAIELDDTVVRALPDRLRPRQSQFDRTGGSHAAGLATIAGEVLLVREDVGRHNAVDKVTGARLLAGEPLEGVLVVSGRAGFELVQKAVVAGYGGLVAVGAPTSLSVDLAQRSGVSLYGFASADRVVRYA